MFFALLLLTLGVALLTSLTVVLFFRRPIRQILDRVIGDDLAAGWHRFLLFAIFVVGVSSGVQIWKLEQYVQPDPGIPAAARRVLALDATSMGLEVYRTVIQTLQGVAWALLLFFVVALITHAIVRRREGRS
ncbi:MAG TPA: hypothetical protein VGJ98_03635 [Candidatus Eisenbacteria bacterium]|jgi:hypothetical protein